MPGIVARIGGASPHEREVEAVLAPLRHFDFYGSDGLRSARGWLGWVGIGEADRRLAHDPAQRCVTAYHGDGIERLPEGARRAWADAIAGLAPDRPLDLARRLGGSFAAARLDLESGEFHCLTDLFGHHRVYYRQVGDTLYVACELKAFLGWPECPVEADDAALRDLVNYGYPLGDRTSLVGVKLLPPASHLGFRDGVLTVARYWRPQYRPEDGDTDALRDEGYRLFSASFRDKTANADKLILPVSGGLDSRLLLCEAQAAGKTSESFTFGHARSREAAVSCDVMRHMGVEPVHLRTDEVLDAAASLCRTSWFGEGMVSATASLVGRVCDMLADEPRTSLFVNGIYGGPTNFSNGYHRPDELIAGMARPEKVSRIGRTMFSHLLHTPANYRKLQPEFARECDASYDREIDRLLDDHVPASPLFGHQKDAFFIDNRLCRFMNQIDLNRYSWDEVIPLTSVDLYEFYLRLPDRLKFGRLLHRRILADIFPHAADTPIFSSGLTVHEELAGTAPRAQAPRLQRLQSAVRRLTLGRYNPPDPEDYGSHDYVYRRNPGMRRVYESVLGAERPLSADRFDFEVIRGYLRLERRGGMVISALSTALAWELWLRQLRERRPDVV